MGGGGEKWEGLRKGAERCERVGEKWGRLEKCVRVRREEGEGGEMVGRMGEKWED